MIRLPFFFPIYIRVGFLFMAALLGFIFSQNLPGTIIWIGIIFVSVFVHELGHAITAAFFGKRPRIEFILTGGVTYHDGEDLALPKQFLIVLNGPLFGFALFYLAHTMSALPNYQDPTWQFVLVSTAMINLFWTMLNLLPVLPLDGGHLLRIVFEGIFSFKGISYAHFSSACFGILLALAGFAMGNIVIGIIFFMFGFDNIRAWNQTRLMTEDDCKKEVRQELQEAQIALLEQNEAEAEKHLERIVKDTKGGLFHQTAAEQLALLCFDRSDIEGAYKAFKEAKDLLSPQSRCAFHTVASEMKDYAVVIELGDEVFAQSQDAETALRNALAYAERSDENLTLEWIKSAIEYGLKNVKQVAESEPEFKKLPNSGKFHQYVNSL